MDPEETHPFSNLIARNVPHIPEKIFLYLDLGSFKTCLRVSKVWNNFLMNESYQRKAASVFHEELLKEEATSLAGKIRAYRRYHWIREVIVVLLAFLAIYVIYFFLIERAFSPKYYKTERISDVRPVLKGELLWVLFAHFLAYFVSVIFVYIVTWIDTAYRRNKRRFTMETYKRKAQSVPREGITMNDQLLEIWKKILEEEEEKLCLQDVGFLRLVASSFLPLFSALSAIMLIIEWCCPHCWVKLPPLVQ